MIPYQSPYGYAIRSSHRPLTHLKKLYRFYEIHCLTIFLLFVKFFQIFIPSNNFYSYIRNIRDADVVISMGGGYLITRNKLTDYFGLLLMLLPIYIAKFYKKKILLLPQTFGPFASRLHEQLAYRALHGTTILSRDHISLDRIHFLDKKNNKVHAKFVPDLALFCKWDKKIPLEKKFKSDYIVLSAREWLPREKQLKYESILGDFVNYVWKRFKLKTKMLIMANNPIEETDTPVAQRIQENIKNNRFFDIIYPSDHREAQDILRDAKLAVCTRMHSAILSFTTTTPFIAIGYGHKTQGLMKLLTLTEWFVDIYDLRYNWLVSKFDFLLKSGTYSSYIKRLKEQRKIVLAFRPKIINDISKFIID